MQSARHTFPRSCRIASEARFDEIYGGKTRESRGPLLVYGMPNELSNARLGLSVSRKVGSAPRRNRIKRLLREAFRSIRHDLPALDLIIVVRPHEELELEHYKTLLTEASQRLHKTWERRGAGPAGQQTTEPTS